MRRKASPGLADGRAGLAGIAERYGSEPGGAAGIRRVGSCCAACGLVSDSEPDRQAGSH